MKTILSALLALSVLAGIAAPASAFDSKTFWEQQDRSHFYSANDNYEHRDPRAMAAGLYVLRGNQHRPRASADRFRGIAFTQGRQNIFLTLTLPRGRRC